MSMESEDRRTELFRRTGLLLAALAAAYLLLFLLSKVIDPDAQAVKALEPTHLALVAMGSVLLSVSALVPSLNWIQPIVLLVVTPIPLVNHTASMFSLGTFIAAEILLAKLGFFETARLPKYILTILYYFACEVLVGIIAGQSSLEILSPLLFSAIFLSFLILVYGDRWFVYLKEPKPSLSLSALRITPMEAVYLKALLAGLSIKEISIDGKVKESTVRNTLARVYRKFGVQDKAALMAKCEHYRLVD